MVGLAVYTVIATTIGSNLPDNVLLLSIYYLVAGLVWIWPAAREGRRAAHQEGPARTHQTGVWSLAFSLPRGPLSIPLSRSRSAA